MKKYVKPELFYERFELNQHIADCDWEQKTPANSTCVAKPDAGTFGEGYPETLFTSTTCTIDAEISQDYCYQPGANGSPKLLVS